MILIEYNISFLLICCILHTEMHTEMYSDFVECRTFNYWFFALHFELFPFFLNIFFCERLTQINVVLCISVVLSWKNSKHAFFSIYIISTIFSRSLFILWHAAEVNYLDYALENKWFWVLWSGFFTLNLEYVVW